MRLQPGQRREIKGSYPENYRFKVIAECFDTDTPLVEVHIKRGAWTQDRGQTFVLHMTDTEANALAHRLQRAQRVLPTSK